MLTQIAPCSIQSHEDGCTLHPELILGSRPAKAMNTFQLIQGLIGQLLI